jgi:hypothetical protein
MRTLIYKIKISKKDEFLLKNLQDRYSKDFRRVYKNLELSQDKEFLSSLNMSSSKLKEYLVKEVTSFWEKYQSTKNKIRERLESDENLSFKKITELKRSLKSDICFGGRKNLQRRTKGLISNSEWKELRLYPIVFYGETSRKGNRFFDFKALNW